MRTMPRVQCRRPVNFSLSRGENCAGWVPKEAAELCQLRVNFRLRFGCPPEKNGAVQVQGLGLELHARAEAANRDKGSFP